MSLHLSQVIVFKSKTLENKLDTLVLYWCVQFICEFVFRFSALRWQAPFYNQSDFQ